MINHRLFAATLLGATAIVAAAPASAQRIDRIVTFGDSYADDDNFFQLAGIPLAATQVYTTGRFSGGTNYVDTLGTILNVPINNFAIGGARAGIGNQSNPFSWGFTYEVDQFTGVGAQSAIFPTISTFQPGDLVTVSIGGNDSRAYQQGGGTVAGASAAAAAAAASASGNLNRLVAAGAPTISFLAGDTGQLPEVGFAANPALAASVRTAFSTAFNANIQSTLSGYAANGVIVHYLDLTKVLGDITPNLARYGLTGLACPAFPAPAGPGVPGSTACASTVTASNFLFYGDQLHLTSVGFAIVARFVAAQLTAPLTLRAPGDLELDSARQFARTMTTRMDLGAPRDGDMPEGLGIYIVGDTFSRTLAKSDTNDQFKTTSTGYTAGAEYGFGAGMVGIAANVSRTKANFFNDAASAKGRVAQIGVYGAAGIAGGFVQGYAGYGRDELQLRRTGVLERISASPNAHRTEAGIKAGYLAPLGTVRVGPVAALDYARAKVDGYTESGDPALNLTVGKVSAKSLRGSLGGEVRGDLDVGGLSFRPYAAVVAEKEFDNGRRTFDFAQTSAPTIVNHFTVDDSSSVYGRVSGGFSAAMFANISINGTVSGTFAKDGGNETSGHVSLRAAF